VWHAFYGREDPGLGSRLLRQLPGVLNWALAGYRRLQQRGHFLQPDSARDAIADLETLGSPIKALAGK
jgi:putative DNA primase/helicase